MDKNCNVQLDFDTGINTCYNLWMHSISGSVDGAFLSKVSTSCCIAKRVSRDPTLVIPNLLRARHSAQHVSFLHLIDRVRKAVSCPVCGRHHQPPIRCSILLYLVASQKFHGRLWAYDEQPARHVPSCSIGLSKISLSMGDLCFGIRLSGYLRHLHRGNACLNKAKTKAGLLQLSAFKELERSLFCLVMFFGFLGFNDFCSHFQPWQCINEPRATAQAFISFQWSTPARPTDATIRRKCFPCRDFRVPFQHYPGPSLSSRIWAISESDTFVIYNFCEL